MKKSKFIFIIIPVIIFFSIVGMYFYNELCKTQEPEPGKVIFHNKINISDDYILEFERFIPKRVTISEDQIKNVTNDEMKYIILNSSRISPFSFFSIKNKTLYIFKSLFDFDEVKKKITFFSIKKEFDLSTNKEKDDLSKSNNNLKLDFSADCSSGLRCARSLKDTPNVYCYDYIKSNWSNSKSAKFNIPRSEFASIEVNDSKILIIGGEDCNSKTLKTVELYDPRSGQIKLYSKILAERTNPNVVKLKNNKILITGGDKYSNSAEIYDYNSNKSLRINDFYPYSGNIEYSYTLIPVNENVLLLGNIISFFDSKKLRFYPISYSQPEENLPLIRFSYDYKCLDDKTLLVYLGTTSPVHILAKYIEYFEIIKIYKIKHNSR